MALSAFNEDGMFNSAPFYIFDGANRLRRTQTRAEILLWSELKKRPDGFKFRRQHPIGIYIADFYCHEAKLIVEVDGCIHDVQSVKAKDAIRQSDLEKLGIQILRFTNHELFQNLEHVIIFIKCACGNRSTLQ